ncbi:hypothetical protein H9P43_008207 [Blastocladiella emersonii ATCC 22665]|nr:hypothetical protein H9P43_008207 [Blastocladiella emersonii ATCC 22665]
MYRLAARALSRLPLRAGPLPQNRPLGALSLRAASTTAAAAEPPSTPPTPPHAAPAKPAFTRLGVRRPLAQAIADTGIAEPTPLQAELIPLLARAPRRDVIVRDATGSGKTYAATVALLNLSPPAAATSVPPPPKGTVRPAHIIVVPHADLAEQIQGWIRDLLPADKFPSLDPIVQLAVTDPPAPEDAEPVLEAALGKPLSTTDPWGASCTTPHIVIGTPAKLLARVFDGSLDVTAIGTLAMDEIDQLTPPIPRFDHQRASVRRRHARPVEALVQAIMAARLRSAGHAEYLDALEHYGTPAALASESVAEHRIPPPARKAWLDVKPRILALSATASASVRNHLHALGWMHPRNAAFLNTSKIGPAAPKASRHEALVVFAGKAAVVNLADGLSKPEDNDPTPPPPPPTAQSRKRGGKPTRDPEPAIDPRRAALPDLRDLCSTVVAYCRARRVASALVIPVVPDLGVSQVVAGLASFYGVSASWRVTRHAERAAKVHHTEANPAVAMTVISANGARGLDLASASHVFLLGAPRDSAEYLHLAGRVGRMGKTGTVVSVVGPGLGGADRLHAIWHSLAVRSGTKAAEGEGEADDGDRLLQTVELDAEFLAKVRDGGSI